MSKVFPIKLAIYFVVFGYILCDLFVFNGPLRKAADQKSGKNSGEIVERMKSEKIAAYVYRQPIYLSQVDYYIVGWLRKRGMNEERISPALLRSLRFKALNYLIEDSLFRVKTELNEDRFPVDDKEVTSAVERLSSRFASRDLKLLIEKEFGIEGEKEMRLRFAATVQQEQYIQEMLTDKLTTREEDLRGYYEQNKKSFIIPERVRCRHLFIAHLEHQEAGGALIQEIYSMLESGDSFEALVEQYSEDLHSKKNGGDLSFFRKDRCLEALRPYLFGGARLAMGEPCVVESSLGFHIVELLEILPPVQLPYDGVKDDICMAMLDFSKPKFLQEMRIVLRAEAGTRSRYLDRKKDEVTKEGGANRIEIFQGVFQEGFSY